MQFLLRLGFKLEYPLYNRVYILSGNAASFHHLVDISVFGSTEGVFNPSRFLCLENGVKTAPFCS